MCEETNFKGLSYFICKQTSLIMLNFPILIETKGVL